MVGVSLDVDESLNKGMKDMARSMGLHRSEFIRNAIYTALWNLHHGGPPMKQAPFCPYILHGEDPSVRLLNGRMVKVDINTGLIIE